MSLDRVETTIEPLRAYAVVDVKGWPKRDLNVGELAMLAPNLEPMAPPIGITVDELRKVLKSLAPGRYGAEANINGKTFRPTPEVPRDRERDERSRRVYLKK